MDADTGTYSFRCAECRRQIVLKKRPLVLRTLCVYCTAAPGWFKNEILRRKLDPDMAAPDWITEKTG
jgi:hypothetical protein